MSDLVDCVPSSGRTTNDLPPCAHPYEGWFVNGTSLETAGFLLSQFVETAPRRRGDNAVAARRPGSVFLPKVYDDRVQSLVVWALKTDRFGNLVGGNLANIDRLKRLFGGGLQQVNLTRRIALPFNRVSTRTAVVELVAALDGRRTALAGAGVYASFAVDLRFADPFWYEPENEALGQGADYGAFVVWNPGTVVHQNARVRVYGPATNPEVTVTNDEYGSLSRFRLALTIPGGEWVEVDSDAFTAVDQTGASVAGALERDGVFLVRIGPGRNTVEVSDGLVDLRWNPAFL